MKKLLLTSLLLTSIIIADKSNYVTQVSSPIEQINKPIRPNIRPKKEVNNYTTVIQYNCEDYIKELEIKDEKIRSLQKELDSLRNDELVNTQKRIEKEYNKQQKQIQKEENKASSVSADNVIKISNTK
ncbi:MAG: hypothetical protein DRQ78_02205 [Epsilonproteobacteria bacterium]|nr:MAG: hypothetical protein DRQ78_02205 [Campylobacterota bacterium]